MEETCVFFVWGGPATKAGMRFSIYYDDQVHASFSESTVRRIQLSIPEEELKGDEDEAPTFLERDSEPEANKR